MSENIHILNDVLCLEEAIKFDLGKVIQAIDIDNKRSSFLEMLLENYKENRFNVNIGLFMLYTQIVPLELLSARKCSQNKKKLDYKFSFIFK